MGSVPHSPTGTQCCGRGRFDRVRLAVVRFFWTFLHLIRFTSLRVCTATYISIDAVRFTLVAVHDHIFRSQDSICFGHKSIQMLKRYTHLHVEDSVARIDEASQRRNTTARSEYLRQAKMRDAIELADYPRRLLPCALWCASASAFASIRRFSAWCRIAAS